MQGLEEPPQKETVKLADLFEKEEYSENLKNLTKEETELVMNLTLSVEIQHNFGGLFPTPPQKRWTCFEFKDRKDPSTILAAQLKQGVVLRKEEEFVYRKKQENTTKEYFLDVAPGKKCFFIFCYHGGIYKKLLDDSDPTQIYKYSSRSARHGANLRTSKNHKLLALNKDKKEFSTMTLNRDRIQARFDHRFGVKTLKTNKNHPLGISKFEFLGNDTLLILLGNLTLVNQKLDVVKYRAENRKVLVRNLLSLPEGTFIDAFLPCPKDGTSAPTLRSATPIGVALMTTL